MGFIKSIIIWSDTDLESDGEGREGERTVEGEEAVAAKRKADWMNSCSEEKGGLDE